MDVTIYPGRVSGSCQVPPSKSHTMRAILFATLARGESRLERVLPSPDTEAMIAACRQLGADLHWQADTLLIRGTAAEVSCEGDIDCGNSGQVLRFVAAVGALGGYPFTLTGDASIRQRRPVHELIRVLQQAGARVTSRGGRPPLQICGPLQPGQFQMRGEDSQPVSALLMASSFLKGPSTLLVTDLGERPWVGLTLWWLRQHGARIEWLQEGNLDRFEIAGGLTMEPVHALIPGDWSSAAFPILAGLLASPSPVPIAGTEGVRVEGLLPDDPQGDKEIVSVLQNMGAKINWQEGLLQARPSRLQGGRLNANAMIDAVPILAAAAPCMRQGILLENVAMARRKESDRLEAMAEGIQRLGGSATVGSDWLEVKAGLLRGGAVFAHHDHRIAMAFSIAALRAEGPVTILGCECVAKSYPGFFEMLRGLRAVVKVQE